MAENKNQKDQSEKEDIKFSREELLDDDLKVADIAREKRNKAMPEQYRSDPSSLTGWPPPEDKLPAVMPADKLSDHDYQLETYDEVEPEHREAEVLNGQPGDVAKVKVREAMAEAIEAGKSTNEVQAPPSPNAELAAEGKGALNTPLPTSANKKPVATKAADKKD